MLWWIATLGGALLMMGQHSRSEALFYYFRLEDQVPALLRKYGAKTFIFSHDVFCLNLTLLGIGQEFQQSVIVGIPTLISSNEEPTGNKYKTAKNRLSIDLLSGGVMKLSRNAITSFLVIILAFSIASAQRPTTPEPQATVVPRFVNLSGRAFDAQGKPIAGVAGATFSIYKDQYEGAPLWMETQNIQADAKGNYTVQLGAGSPEGLPLELFTAREARWLGSRMNGGTEQPRVLLLSVPYALKAADADTLGGKPLSAFQLATQPGELAAHSQSKKVQTEQEQPQVANTITCASGSACKKNFVPVFSTNGGAAKVTDSIMQQSGSNLDVTGGLSASGIVAGGSFNIGNNPFAFGSFANSNAFLGFAGNSTMTGLENTAEGFKALSADTSGGANTANGYAALQVNTSGGGNTASGWGSLANNTTGNDNTANGLYALFSNIGASFNTASGFKALYSNNNVGANYNTASGYEALFANTAGVGNVASGAQALAGTTTGSDNTAVGSNAGQLNTTGSLNTFVGYSSGPAANNTSLVNATTIGAFASATENNTMILGGSGSSAVTVAIGTASPYQDYALDVDTIHSNGVINGGVVVNANGGNLYLGMTNTVHKFRVDLNGVAYADGGFQSSGADFAESLAVRGERSQYEPGDVLEIDQNANRHLALSRHPYATLVAGIYSTKPGLLATPYNIDDPAPKTTEVPLAVVGIVPCKVTAENGPIARGDLLVTSSRAGYAMKGTDRRRLVGAVVGKALEPLPGGAGVIEVLVTLQ
jgi:hypothetical protein